MPVDKITINIADLTQFSSNTLVETCAEQPMDIREQVHQEYIFIHMCILILTRLQTSDENWDSLGKRQIWRCESSK